MHPNRTTKAVLIILALLALTSGISFAVVKKSLISKSQPATEHSSDPPTIRPGFGGTIGEGKRQGFQTYRSEDFGFTFAYPTTVSILDATGALDNKSRTVPYLLHIFFCTSSTCNYSTSLWVERLPVSQEASPYGYWQRQPEILERKETMIAGRKAVVSQIKNQYSWNDERDTWIQIANNQFLITFVFDPYGADGLDPDFSKAEKLRDEFVSSLRFFR